MMNKEIFVVLAQAYIDNFKRMLDIDAALGKYEIYVSDEGNPLIWGMEKAFNIMNAYIIEDLLNIADEGFTEIDNIKIDSVEKLYDYVFGNN